MRRTFFSFLMIWGLCLGAWTVSAQNMDFDFHVEEEGLVEVPEDLAKIIDHNFKDKPSDTCQYKGKTLDLDGDGQSKDWVVTAHGCIVCGSSGNCWLMVLRENKGRYINVLESQAMSLKLTQEKHKNLRDLKEISNQYKLHQTIWRFNGKRYKPSK